MSTVGLHHAIVLSFHLTKSDLVHRSAGVNVPGIRLVDIAEGCLGLEFIEGPTVRNLIPAGTDEPRYQLIFHEEESEGEDEPDHEEIPDTISTRAAEWGCSEDITMGM